MRRLAALGLIFLLPGCFFRAQGGYQTTLPGIDPGGGQLEVSAGLGDFRSRSHPAAPIQYGLDLVGHAGVSGQRLGFGLSTLWAPLSGWDFNWSPTLRLGGRLLQVEWIPEASGSLSGFAELGVALFPDRGTRKRTVYSLCVGAELFGRYGIPGPVAGRFSLLLGVTFDTSIGPTS
jgi:hypothetical protein